MTNENRSRPAGSSTTSSSGGCPVQHSAQVSSSAPSFMWPWTKTATATENEIVSRPVSDNEQRHQPAALSYQPASIEEAAQHAQTPQPDQRIALGTERQVSSIPRSSGTTNLDGSVSRTAPKSSCPVAASSSAAVPHHQHDKSQSHWVYPSEQQLYNAMRRKGWTNVPEDSISTVLQIHNTINEQTWRQIKRWEDSRDIRLTRFQGRPGDLSPKAWLFSQCLRICDPPFDRHDWYVERLGAGAAVSSGDDAEDRPQQRYVIDYYYRVDPHTQLPRPYIDARPALDHPRALLLHGKQFFRDAFPAISRRLFAHVDSHATPTTGDGPRPTA